MSRIKLLVLMVLSWLLAASAVPGESGLTLTLLSPSPQIADPRNPVIVTARISNVSSATLSTAISVGLPEGWSYLALPEQAELAPAAQEIVFINVIPSSNLSAGTYDVVIHATTDGGVALSTPVVIEVPLLESLALASPPPAPGLTVGGSALEQTFTLTNGGNGAASVILTLECRPDWNATLPQTQLTLEAGQSTDLVVKTDIPADLAESANYRVTLSALTASSTDEEPAARTSVLTRVVPRSRSVDDVSMYALLEGTQISELALQSDGSFSMQQKLDLSGDLGHGRSGSVDITMPWLKGGDTFSSQQRATLEYKDPAWGFAAVGDRWFYLQSDLLRSGGGGRGFEFGLTRGPTDYHVFYSDVPGSWGSRSYGLELIRPLSPEAIITLSTLSQIKSGQASFGSGTSIDESGEFFSAHGSFKPSEGLAITAELAGFDGHASGWDQAYKVTSRYSSEALSAGVDYVYSGSDFFGALRDIEQYRYDLAYKPIKDLRLFTSTSHRLRNVDDDPAKPVVKQEPQTIGASYDFGKGTSLRVHRRTDEWTSSGLSNASDRTVSTEYELRKRWSKSTANLRLESLNNQDRITGLSAGRDRIQCQWSTDLSKSTLLSLDYSLADLRREFGEPRSGHLSGILRFVPDKKSKASLMVRQGFGSNSSYWLGGEYQRMLSGERELEVKLQSYGGSFGDDLVVALQYTMPLSFNVKQFPVSGVIQGRVFSAHDPSRGFAGALVQVDNLEVVTGEDGRFSIPGLVPGEYLLSLDSSTISVGAEADAANAVISLTGGSQNLPGELSLQPLSAEDRRNLNWPDALGAAHQASLSWPLKVLVVEGQTSDVQIPVVSLAAVSGRVMQKTADAPGQVAMSRPMADVVLELTGPRGILYRLSDSAGSFIFSELQEGQYSLKVRTDRLSGYMAAEPEVLEIELTPGEIHGDANFVLLLQEREIEITTEMQPSS